MALFTKTAGASIAGTTGDDIILVASAAAMSGGSVDGDAGTDELRFTSTAGETLVLGNNVINVERVVIGTGTGTTALTTGTATNGVDASAVGYGLTITGNAGNNAITGTAFADQIDGGAGNDTMTGGAGDDTYFANSAADIVTELAGEGTDTVNSSVTYTLAANVENLVLTGTANINGTGNALNNTIIGNAGNNTLDGGAGDDTLIGGAGNDTYVVNSAADVVTELAGQGIDTVRASLSYTLGVNVENLVLTGTGSINGTGNELNNSLTGNAGDNTLDGGLGADTMAGGAGNDTYIVDNTADVVTEAASAGTDTVRSSVTYTLSANVENLVLIDTGNVDGTGNTLANVITGNAGNNTLSGGSGADTMIGGAGDDTYVVDNAGDVVTELAGEGTDTVRSSVSYTLASNVENLVLTGTANINGTGNALNNTLTGNAGNNTLNGGTGDDTLIGGAGNDTYVVDSAADVVTEAAGEGIDTVQSSLTYTLGANVENLVLTGTANINGTGNDLANSLTGNSGTNTLVGGAGADTLSGGAGADTLIGGTGDDTYVVDNVGDVVTEALGEGTDTVNSSVTYTLAANLENLVLTGTSSINGTGNTLANTLTGNSGNNTLDGGAGDDTLIGGAGNDTYVVDSAGDVVTEAAGQGTDTVRSGVSYVLPANVENLVLMGTANINGTGNDLANSLTGNAGNNTLDGGLGADTMAGGAGDDTYIVDNVADMVTEAASAGSDTVRASATYTLAANVENLVLTGTANIDGAGNTLANTLTGNSGNNTLDGGTGADNLAGGAGDDTYVVDNAGDVVTELASEGADTVRSSLSYVLVANVENLVLTGTGNINGTGNTLDNAITGNAGNNVLDGGAGDDTARFSGVRANYSVAAGSGGSFIVTDLRTGAPDGADTVQNIEFLQFADITIPTSSLANNSSPVAVADTASTNEDTVLTLLPATLTANDTDADNDTLTLTAVGGATHGSVVLNAGNVVFTPATNYNGAAGFTYTLSDGKGGTAIGTVNVTVNPVNDSPVATNDTGFSTPLNTPLSIPLSTLLSNDTDVDGDALTVSAVGGALNGSVTITGGNAVFTPTPGYSGPANFSYTLRDPSNATTTGNVSLLVGTPLTNAIVAENQRPGSPESEWGVDGAGDSNIEGFATDISVNHGQTVDFKINTNSTHYRVDVYRLGYYQGNGARKVATFEKQLTNPQVQPTPLFDSTRRLVDAGNWQVSASWDVPADAVSGVYFAKLTRLDGTSGQNIIPFIVRDDSAPSDITFQTADTTWQAYNPWGGYNLYQSVVDGNRGYAVSYNRPITTRGGGLAAGPQDFIFSVEYPAIRWLEQNGYNVNYISGVDTARDGAQLLNGKVFLSVGHDEYWSADQRANVEAARDAGVNLAFWSGNEVYWKTRWETSIDGSGTPYRTLVSYKERRDNANIDLNGDTSTWRDPELGPGQPENALTGTMFTVDSYRLDTIQIPYALSNFRFWRNTDIANLQPGQTGSLVPNLLGYEWDSDVDNGFRPAGLVPLSLTTIPVDTLLYDYGSKVGPGTSTHSLTLYRDDSGALVFGAGTVYWSWGLDSNHDLEATPTDPNVQQAMVNLFADMGVQPGTLMASLALASQSTDTIAPVSTIASPFSGGSYQAYQPIIVSGQATDSGGGSVAVVEVSTDGGGTWHRANGFENWTYSWVPLSAGNVTIRSRAVDDSINLETPGTGVSITVAPSSISLFAGPETPAVVSNQDNPVELGVKFTATTAGTISGLKFYRGVHEQGTHVGSLWTSTGTLLGSATFTNETPSGWQVVSFTNPVSISSGTTYVASYHSNGGYASTSNYFATARTNGPLTAPASATSGGNGLFAYSSSPVFPTGTYNAENYWVDVLFNPSGAQVNEPPDAVNDSGFTTTQDTGMSIAASLLLANDTDPNGDLLTVSGVSNATNGTVSFNSQTNTITFTPTAGYTGLADFQYSIADGRGGTDTATVGLSVTPPETGVRLFSNSDTPAVLSNNDQNGVELGVKFTSSSAGTISGLKFYKGVQDTGTHVGSLWTSTGTLLGSATFTNETASGWQSVSFANPVSISSGTTYVASFHSNGGYASTSNYFATAHTSGPLTAPASSTSGGNGVFTYGGSSVFPNSSWNATNYWVDVVFNALQNQAPDAVSDSGFTTVQNVALSIPASTLLANDTDPNGDALSVIGVSNPVNGTANFNSQTNTITFTPTAGYTGAANFDYSIADGQGGTDTATVGLTVTVPPAGEGVFSDAATPAIITVNDSNDVELGLKFRADVAGSITAIQFYKGPSNTDPHEVHLWTNTGTLLASANSTGETTSGWQTVPLAQPVSITPGTTYVASYHSDGFYSASPDFFAADVLSGHLLAPSSSSSGGNGVYAYGAPGTFPTNTYNNNNYWVDVVFNQFASLP